MQLLKHIYADATLAASLGFKRHSTRDTRHETPDTVAILRHYDQILFFSRGARSAILRMTSVYGGVGNQRYDTYYSKE